MTIVKAILGLLIAGLVVGAVVAAMQVFYVIGVVLMLGVIAFGVAAFIVDAIRTWWRSR